MKILMFGWEFPPYNSGGLGVACQGLTRALANKEVDLSFVLPKHLDLDLSYMELLFADNGKTIKFLAINSILAPYMTSNSYGVKRKYFPQGMYGNGLFEEVERYGQVAHELASEHPHDIIHVHDWLSIPAGLAAQEASGKPLVVHIHATEFDRTGGNGVNQHVYEVEKEGVHKAQRVIAVSNLTKNILVDHYGVNPKKITVVHNGVDMSQYNLSTTSDVIGLSRLKKLGFSVVIFVGRITLQKGPDYFLETAKKVLQYNKKVLFIIAGSGDMEAQIIMRGAQLGISDRLLFAGFLRGNDLSNLYKLADLFVMPSVSEPFGLTALEAMVHSTPILISKQSGVAEVADHALKADFWDIDDMADKVLAITQYKKLKKLLGSNGFAQAKECSWDRAAKKCVNVYNELLK